ncbi:hypothetical protein F511_23578 [Dorcoceras hygrometricum]|uniref:Uncharacterized protein n=1 Tax=Dorcoceras hygrometricum TaxID=472368 RepID=A0A2Z7AWE6_9LAMI|nr:hypothetical protein F511_23578 [Dorcoceras hygrometricum]
METSKVKSGVRNQAEAKLNQLERSESAGTIRISCKRYRRRWTSRNTNKITSWNRNCEVCWRIIEEEQFSSELQCSEVEEISCWIEAKRNRESAVMTSAYILEEAMSSKDDVITISSYQEVQDLESAMMTSAVMSSQSADKESSWSAKHR